jgi:hypothetical protein
VGRVIDLGRRLNVRSRCIVVHPVFSEYEDDLQSVFQRMIRYVYCVTLT